MTDVQDTTNGSEPSMEEILASIRRIIADEKEEPEVEAAPEEVADEEILELTEAVQDDGSVETVEPEPVAEVAPEPEPEPEEELEMALVEEEPEPVVEGEPLVSDEASTVAAASMAALASKVDAERQISMLGNGSRTLEGMVMELMKPMLKSWLDANLPSIVERIVQKEVERISHKGQD